MKKLLLLLCLGCMPLMAQNYRTETYYNYKTIGGHEVVFALMLTYLNDGDNDFDLKEIHLFPSTMEQTFKNGDKIELKEDFDFENWSLDGYYKVRAYWTFYKKTGETEVEGRINTFTQCDYVETDGNMFLVFDTE
jgi:hypothetical protein